LFFSWTELSAYKMVCLGIISRQLFLSSINN